MIKLYDYQKKILDYMAINQRCIVWAEQGSGKTIIILEHAKANPDKLRLIVTKKNLITNAIINDNNKYYHLKIDWMGVDGTEIKDKKELDPSTIYLTNYEYLLKRENFFCKYHWDIIYLDEAHAIGNRGSAISKLFHAARPKLKYDSIYLLTGTLIPNKEEQVYPLIRAITPLYWKDFSAMFFCQPIPSIPYVYKLIESRRKDFWEYISRYLIKITKEDTGIEWATKKYIEYPFSLSEEQIVAHREILKHGAYGELVVDYAVTTMLKLRQITSGYLQITDNRYYEFQSERFRVLDEIVCDLKARSHIIIFYNFDYDLAAILRACDRNKKQMYFFCGDISQVDKDTALREWKKHGGCLSINIASGKNGLTLIEASDVIFYNLADNNEAYEQAQDRIHRIGQEAEEVRYHIIVAKNSIDEVIVKSLRRKANISKELKSWINASKKG